jgi:hypothetical protein
VFYSCLFAFQNILIEKEFQVQPPQQKLCVYSEGNVAPLAFIYHMHLEMRL